MIKRRHIWQSSLRWGGLSLTGALLGVAALAGMGMEALSDASAGTPTTQCITASAAVCPSSAPPIVAFASSGNGGALATTSSGAVYQPNGGERTGLTGLHLNRPIVGIAGTPGTDAYWLVASDGGVFAFNSANPGLPGAQFFGSMGGTRLNKPVVGIASTPDGNGYWLVASDGGVFSFGDAQFYGSTGSIVLNKPIVGMTSTPDGHGYWLVASDGGIFAFGDAAFYGSLGATPSPKPIVGMASIGNGYWIVNTAGTVYSFGSAPAVSAYELRSPIVGIIAVPIFPYGTFSCVADSDGEDTCPG